MFPYPEKISTIMFCSLYVPRIPTGVSGRFFSLLILKTNCSDDRNQWESR